MYRIRKLSVLLAFAMILQLGVPGLSAPRHAEAAPSGPAALSFYPADNLTNVPLGANLRILFDENIKLGSATTAVTIYRSSDNQVVERISVGSGRITISEGREAIIDPLLSATSNRFDLNTEYYALVDAGAFLNVSNNAPYAGIQSATRWNFRTVVSEDSVKPTLAAPGSYSPATAGTHSITSIIRIQFSEPVYASNGYITLESADDTRSIPVTSSMVTGSGSTEITITPDGALLPTATYTVRIAGDNFQDASGNSFDAMQWSFTTASAPVNLAASNPFFPADDATLIPIASNLTIRFDQDVQANAGRYVEIRRVSDNKAVYRLEATDSAITIDNTTDTVTINLPEDLAPSTAYYVLIQPGAFSRPAPNTGEWFYGISAATIWNFSTGYGNDTTAPSLTSLSPSNNGSAVSTSTNLVLTFNEVVYPNTGTIEIRQSVGGGLFRSIPVTSTRVRGGGTNQLTIDATGYVSSSDPAKSFLNNTKYYVTIGNRAIRDGAGNFYAGISGTSGWAFTITQDGTRPLLVSVSPSNGSTAVDTSGTFTATFDKPIARGDLTKEIQFTPVSSGVTVDANFYVDSADNKKMIIVPSSPLAANTNYYIAIDEGAITDLVGNAFAGILNQYQWTFLTKGGDTTQPAITKSEVSGSVIRLIYNEPLNTELSPSVASYYATVAGAARSIRSVQIEGNMVLLTLSSSVGYSQKVELSYTKPFVGLVQDLSGNQAAGFSKLDISNGFTSTNPVISSGSAYNNVVVLNFSEALMTPNAYAYTQFTVEVGGINYSPTAIWHSGNVVQLTLSSSIPSGQSVRVSYTPGSYPLYGTSGSQVNSISGYNVTGSTGTVGDVSAPVLQSITAAGTIVTLKYNEYLNPGSTPGIYQYSVLADSQTRTISGIVIAGDSVYLTLGTAVTSGQTVRVSYISNGLSVMDLSGNAATSFTNVTANAGTGTGTGGIATMQGAILKGSKLTLNFSAPLNQTSIPSASLFIVRVKDMVRVVSSVQISSSTVILTLASPANVGEKAEISYYTNASGLKSSGGEAVPTFANVNVANQTTLLDTLTGDYEAAEDGQGVVIKSSGAMSTSDVSHGGTAANRYTLNNDKFIAAVTTARNAGLASPRIAFMVPDSQKAAIVAVSVITLEMAYKQGGDVILEVLHGDVSYRLPLRELSFAQLATAVGGNGVSNQLVVEIDPTSTTLTLPLSNAIKSAKATVVEGPASFAVSVVNGSQEQELKDFGGYLTRTFKTTSTVNEAESSVVWLDPVTATLSYVPTSFKTTNGVTTATFHRQGNSVYALVKNTSSFSDMGKHWAADTVQMMARKFIVEGHTVSKYEPDKPITRGEFATYIAKGLGLQGDRSAAAKFKDVNSSTVMGAYIGAAASAGIVNGIDSTTFKPNSYITRQDMATMMMRAWKAADKTITLPSSQDSYLSSFTDRSKVSSYAKASMAQAIYLGIINGKSATTLSPTTNASRAEGAVMIMRLLEKAEFLTQ
ncbi:Ig-like domain-containing protein [Paenibacillus sp. PL2-23]|uniref:Ig-like domain-containing protein n=1 Tax=Paenibacillus sp. PL2-23 TaxID=2100729 RepID=UPI0030FA171A